jgi:hypothetical protein
MRENHNECNRIKDLFGPYLYNNVTPSERADVENHVSGCKSCAADLLSRQEVLGFFKPNIKTGDMAQTAQENFVLNVYKRIALDSLKHRSRQAFIQRFVLQPSLAMLILTISITTFFLRYHPGQLPIVAKGPVSVAVNTDENTKKELRADSYVSEFYNRQGSSYKNESKPVSAVKSPEAKNTVKLAEAKSKALSDKPSPSDGNILAESSQTPDPKNLLEEANFIHFSLGDRKRALAQYQKLVDNYPNSEAAKVASEIIKSIRQTEYRVQNENAGSVQNVDLEI